jgi:hypothetical protein
MIPLSDKACPLFVIPRISSLVQVEEEHQQGSLKTLVEEEFDQAECLLYEPKAPADELVEEVTAA